MMFSIECPNCGRLFDHDSSVYAEDECIVVEDGTAQCPGCKKRCHVFGEIAIDVEPFTAEEEEEEDDD